MKEKRTPNGKTCFDIRKQYRRVSKMLIERQHKETKKLLDSGEIITDMQYAKHRQKQYEAHQRLTEWTENYIKTVYAGRFPLYGS